jgi:hypothetical protein
MSENLDSKNGTCSLAFESNLHIMPKFLKLQHARMYKVHLLHQYFFDSTISPLIFKYMCHIC